MKLWSTIKISHWKGDLILVECSGWMTQGPLASNQSDKNVEDKSSTSIDKANRFKSKSRIPTNAPTYSNSNAQKISLGGIHRVPTIPPYRDYYKLDSRERACGSLLDRLLYKTPSRKGPPANHHLTTLIFWEHMLHPLYSPYPTKWSLLAPLNLILQSYKSPPSMS